MALHFLEGYTYKFETLANGTCESYFTVLDTDKPGISNVELFRSPSTFTAMTLVSGQQVYSNYNRTSCWHRTSLAGKFPYAAGGVVQTKISNTLLVTIVVLVVQMLKMLTDLKVGGQTVASFVPGKLTYSVVLPKEQQRYLKLLQ
jgi:hypothetical protein